MLASTVNFGLSQAGLPFCKGATTQSQRRCVRHIHHPVPVGCCHCLCHLLLQPELPQTCSPAAARRAVKSHADRIPQLDRQQQLVPLLGYCLRDLDLSSGPAGGWLQDVQGLRLLPLADGSSLATFSACVGPAGVQQPPVFVVTDGLELSLVDSQRELLLGAGLL